MRFENLYVVELIFRFGVLQAKILLFSRRTAYLRTGYDNLVRKVAVRSRRCRETIFVCRSQLVRVAKSSTRAASSDRRICAFESARPGGRLSRTNRSLEATSEKWGAFRTKRPCLDTRVPCFSPLPRARTRQVVFVFSLHLFTRLLQHNDCQCVWCEGFCISPSPYASHSRSSPHRTKSLLFSGIVFKSSGVPTRNNQW